MTEPYRTVPDVAPPCNRTLGWSVIEWCHDNLLQPDGPDAGKRWQFTGEQVRFILRWYEIDAAGNFTNIRGTLRRMKGWGKDPLCATLAAVEMAGPCRFGGWNEGEPVVVPVINSLVQVAAVNINQTWNTFGLFPNLFTDECKTRYGIEVHKELVYCQRGGKIQAITANPRAMQGARSTFFIANETAEWTRTNDGHRMMDNAAANAAKGRGGNSRILEICNAFVPGEDSVAERTYAAWQRTRSAGASTGDYYDSVEAPADTQLHDTQSLTDGLMVPRGDAWWVPIERYISEIQSPRFSPSVTRRLYLNQIVAAEDSLISPQEWDSCRSDSPLQPGDTITVGFDGGKTDDATALVAERVSDRYVETIRCWEKRETDPDDWEVNRTDVDDTVSWVFATYNVIGFYADVALWETYVDSWADRYRKQLRVKASGRHAVAWDMRGRKQQATAANERVMSAVVDGSLSHGDDPALRAHVLNAKRRVNNHGVSFGKEHAESKHKIDLYAAMVLADTARHDLIAQGKYRHETPRAVVFR